MSAGRPARRWRLSGSDGVAALDLALIFPAALGLLLAMLDIAAVVLTQGVLDNAVTRAASRIAHGTLAPAASHAALADEVCGGGAIPLLPRAACEGGLLLDVRPLSADAPDPISGGAVNASAFGTASGGAGDLLLVRAALSVPTFLPTGLPFLANLSDGERLVVSGAMTRIDPYADYNVRGAQ